MTYETRTISVVLLPEGEPLFSEMATIVRIEDESGGEFVVIEQHGDTWNGKLAIEPSEWPVIREAINKMVESCRS